MIPPTDAAVSLRYAGVMIVCGTQMGKTSALFNICGEKLDDDPAPVLWIGPTKSNVESVIEPQFESMVSNSPTLCAKASKTRQKKLLKNIAGTVMRFAWSGSATEIASMPAHTVIVDEVDKCLPVPGHGSVLVQAEARLSNYRQSGGILVGASSPTEGSVETEIHPTSGLEHFKVSDPTDISSESWKRWQAGTRHEIMVPCPHCGEYFAPRLKYLTGWDEGDSPAKAKRKARLLHWKCGSLIEPSYKQSMTERCLPIAPGQRVVGGEVVGEAPDSEWFTIWISGFLSTWVSWGDRAYQWLSAARSHDQDEIRATLNLAFGELFRVQGEAPPWEDVSRISSDSNYELGLIPEGVRKVFLSVDVQTDHLVLVTRGWGVELESWLLEREEIWGRTDEPDIWGRLDGIVDKGFCGKPYDAIAVDSGFRTEQVYTWCEKRLSRAYATKGRDAPSKLYSASDVEVLRNGKKVRRGLKRWIFDHGYFKGWVHDRIRWPQDQPGSWHLGRKVGDDYCRQIVGEQRMRLASGKTHWVKSGINDYLDCEALQVLLAHIENVRYLKPLDAPPAPKPPPRGTRNRGLEM
jgi:phage terminase large subunit GpA-like protein